MASIDKILVDYHRFLREKTVLKKTDSEWYEISTPFIGLFNDTLEIYVKRVGDSIQLSDDGETLNRLELAGLSISRSPRRKEIFQRILNNYGVQCQNSELQCKALIKQFPQKKLDLLSAMMEIGDLHQLASHKVASVFTDDVKSYLDENNIEYTREFTSIGSTGL